MNLSTLRHFHKHLWKILRAWRGNPLHHTSGVRALTKADWTFSKVWGPSDGKHTTPALLPFGSLHLFAPQASQTLCVTFPQLLLPQQPAPLLETFIYEDGLIIFPIIQAWTIRHLWSVPLLALHLIGLLDCVKSLFAPSLNSNPFHSYCRAPGGYLYVFCLWWLSWFLLCVSNSAEEIDSGAVRQWFKVTFSHLPMGTENPVGIFFPFLPLFTSGMEMVIVCAL